LESPSEADFLSFIEPDSEDALTSACFWDAEDFFLDVAAGVSGEEVVFLPSGSVFDFAAADFFYGFFPERRLGNRSLQFGSICKRIFCTAGEKRLATKSAPS